ncbi:MAG: hypothetical protein KDD69_11505, partial [Bdellovibrionales bacterium]|nr:hypothetical protein [Bdellovibrionales bacterium]
MKLQGFEHFAARAYLNEYFGSFDTEDHFLLTFCHDVYEALPPVEAMVEIGGGPCIYPLISARRRAERILFAEYCVANRAEVEAWRLNAADAFDWSPQFSFIQQLEGFTQSVDEMQQELRRKLLPCIPCDVFDDEPLTGLAGQ